MDEKNLPLHLLSPSTFLHCTIESDILLNDSALIVPLITKIMMLGWHMSDIITWTDAAGDVQSSRIGDSIRKQHVCTVEIVMGTTLQKEHNAYYEPLIKKMGG